MHMQPESPSKVEQILENLAIYEDSQAFLAELSRQSVDKACDGLEIDFFQRLLLRCVKKTAVGG